MLNHFTIWLFLLVLVSPSWAQQRDPRAPAPAPAKPEEDPLDEFNAAIEVLRQIVQQIALPIAQEGDPDPLKHVVIAPASIRVRGQFQLTKQKGRAAFLLARPNEASIITLEVEVTFDVASGKLRVTEAKKIMAGETKK
jgi:hypothetical protein